MFFLVDFGGYVDLVVLLILLMSSTWVICVADSCSLVDWADLADLIDVVDLVELVDLFCSVGFVDFVDLVDLFDLVDMLIC